MIRPLIGITAAPREHGVRRFSYQMVYVPVVRAVEAAGGLPVMIPAGLEPEHLRGIYERIDGVLLPGGGDVHPDFYHAPLQPETSNMLVERDQTEIQLARWAYEEHKPLLGICRGHQVINVALGGTLIQHLPGTITSDITHDAAPDEAPGAIMHAVQLAQGSRLARYVSERSVAVNSRHHQAIDRLARGLEVVGAAADGTIEAVEAAEEQYLVGIQWHPEDLFASDATHLLLFRSFVQAASQPVS
jgi:putative glutamine amidotransferase